MIRPGREARRAAARLCVIDVPGPEPSDRLARLLADDHLGGVCLFRKNVISAPQVAGLASTLHEIGRRAGAPPALVSIDHEGGAVNRFGTGPHAATPFPSAMAIAATDDAAMARGAGTVAGRELSAMGITLNFAPVMDVNNNPANPIIGARAFGGSPDVVTTMGLAYIEGLQAEGVAATAKHFPGHGDVTVDSHAALPRVDHGADRLHAVELAPFRAAAAAGVGAVMTAHVVFPALDPTCVPATMSALILSGLLRERWGYQGLIVSDSLAMRAIADHGGIGDAAVRAVTAGCDLLLALGPDEVQDEVLERLARAIEGGIISEERLAGTRARVADAARRWAVGAAPAAPVEEVVGTPAHHDLARRIAEAAVTLVRDRAGTIPAHGRVGVVDFTSGHDESRSSTFAQVLSRYHPEVREIRAGGRDAATDLDSDAVVAVLGTRGRPSEALTAAVREIHSRIGDRLVVLSAGDPFDLFAFPGVPAWMVCYGTDAPSLHAAARVLVGQITARGRLPVALPGLSAAGEGT